MSTTPSATYEDVKGYDIEALIAFMNGKFGLNENELRIFRDQGIDGESFLMLNEERFKECNIRMGPRAKLVNLINELNSQSRFQNSLSFVHLTCYLVVFITRSMIWLSVI